jgi:hypothetical protein
MTTVGRAAAFALLFAAAPAAVRAAAPDQDATAQARRLEGAWRVQITLRNCQTGDAVGAPFLSLVTFARGGAVVGATARTSPALLAPFYGTWGLTGSHTYRSVAQAFLFNPAGTWSGTQTLTQTIEIDQPDQYHVTATIEIDDPVGNIVSTGCATAIGHRLSLN